jgi:hypothetical protein
MCKISKSVKQEYCQHMYTDSSTLHGSPVRVIQDFSLVFGGGGGGGYEVGGLLHEKWLSSGEVFHI